MRVHDVTVPTRCTIRICLSVINHMKIPFRVSHNASAVVETGSFPFAGKIVVYLMVRQRCSYHKEECCQNGYCFHFSSPFCLFPGTMPCNSLKHDWCQLYILLNIYKLAISPLRRHFKTKKKIREIFPTEDIFTTIAGK